MYARRKFSEISSIHSLYKGPAESPPLGERNAKLTLGLGKIAKTYIFMYIHKIFPNKLVETGVYSMLNG